MYFMTLKLLSIEINYKFSTLLMRKIIYVKIDKILDYVCTAWTRGFVTEKRINSITRYFTIFKNRIVPTVQSLVCFCLGYNNETLR